jgi:hypothetical protein
MCRTLLTKSHLEETCGRRGGDAFRQAHDFLTSRVSENYTGFFGKGAQYMNSW